MAAESPKKLWRIQLHRKKLLY
ncbi:hypothetical protein S40285_09668 [Stachybotrys chlorohalonatus IBT 40285]|uniref:Uncharacterized protein n=1 Tax=Stachybotrys chlorohalonatus (strain IBT 40285) TaxID=1283841 RepID=A0A084QZU9_STAC4|nr:hypothetical protein S40285_09668 [Stachybotrys chlorohalonata IBT 40285]